MSLLCSVEAEASDEDSDEPENSGPSEDKGIILMEPKRPPAALAAVRYASASNAENLEYYGWGEVVQCYRTRCSELAAMKLKPTASPIVHLAVSWFSSTYRGAFHARLMIAQTK